MNATLEGTATHDVTVEDVEVQKPAGKPILARLYRPRGTGPFWPVMADVRGQCLQLPTTLPTLDELIGVAGMDAQAAAEEILRRSRDGSSDTHVFTLHAELEGQKLLPQFTYLLQRWREAGLTLASMHEYHAKLDGAGIARHELVWSELAGRSGVLASQGAALPGVGPPA